MEMDALKTEVRGDERLVTGRDSSPIPPRIPARFWAACRIRSIKAFSGRGMGKMI
jgi:hypothetical protein